MNDPEFLQQVLESLPGVDPNSEAIQSAMSSLTRDSRDSRQDKKDTDKKWALCSVTHTRALNRGTYCARNVL